MAKKHSIALREFAKKHKMKISWFEQEDAKTGKEHLYPVIYLGDDGDIMISDPSDPEYGISKAGERSRYLRRIAKDHLLQCFVSSNATNRLYKSIGFDRRRYYSESNDAPDPNSSRWGRILPLFGFQYLGGDDGGLSFLFQSEKQVSNDMILTLAHMPGV